MISGLIGKVQNPTMEKHRQSKSLFLIFYVVHAEDELETTV